MKNVSMFLIAIIAIVSSCTPESNNGDENLDYLKQRIHCSNYMMDFDDSSEKVGFDRDGVTSIGEVHFSANNKNMYYEYLVEKEFELVESTVSLLNQEGGVLATKKISMNNSKEYALFAYGVMEKADVFAPDFVALELNTELGESGVSYVRFAHFNPNYERLKIEVGESELVIPFGEVSEQVSFTNPSEFAFDAYGSVNDNYVPIHSMDGYGYTLQNNHIFIFSLESQAGGDNMVYKMQEVE